MRIPAALVLAALVAACASQPNAPVYSGSSMPPDNLANRSAASEAVRMNRTTRTIYQMNRDITLP